MGDITVGLFLIAKYSGCLQRFGKCPKKSGPVKVIYIDISLLLAIQTRMLHMKMLFWVTCYLNTVMNNTKYRLSVAQNKNKLFSIE